MSSFSRAWWSRRPWRRGAPLRALTVRALTAAVALAAMLLAGAAPWTALAEDEDCCCRSEHFCLCKLIDARASCSRIGSGPADCSLGGATAPPPADARRLSLPPIAPAGVPAGAEEPVALAGAEPVRLASLPAPPPSTPPPRPFRSA